MTIEATPPANPSPKAHANGHAANAKAAKAGSDAAADSGSTGFMAILGALGEDAPDDAAATAAPLTSVATDPADADGALVDPSFDATSLLAQNPQISAAQAAQAALAAQAAQDAQAAQAAQDAQAAVGAQTSQQAAAASATASGAGLPGDPAARALGRQEDRATPDALAAKTLPGATTQERARANLAAPSSPPVPSDGAQATDTLSSGLQRAAANAKAGRAAAALSSASEASTANSNATNVSERAEPKDVKLLSTLEQARAVVPSRVAEMVLAPLMAKTERPPNERAAVASKQAEPSYVGTSWGVTSPDYSQAAGQASALVAPEMQVAEQVTYWVTQNIKNAELKLDGLGQHPVEVSISVQGNEAQITFRSDEAQTRSVLEGAGTQLKDMLQREGLLLTGVSVGTSGRGDAGGSGGERRGRPNQVRQVQMAALEEIKAPAPRRIGIEAGRSVDLFV